MRRLARLYTLFKKREIIVQFDDSRDMFVRDNFPALREAIVELCQVEEEEDTIKAGLKQNLLYLLKRAAKVLRCLALEKGNDSLSSEIEKFLSLLDLWESLLFGDAVCELNKRRQIKLRRPEVLSDEEDVKLLRDETIRIMETNVTYFDEQSFVRLRDATCTRLTLLNGRRGKHLIHSNTFLISLLKA